MRVLRVGLGVLASAAVLVACPDWDAFTRGSAGEGTDAGASAVEGGGALVGPHVEAGGAENEAGDGSSGGDGGSAKSDAAPATVGVTIDPPALQPEEIVNLTQLGTLDWYEMHRPDKLAIRCSPCARAIEGLEANVNFVEYNGDPRTFRWTNGTAPNGMGSMHGGMFLEGVGNAFRIRIAAAPERRLAVVYIDTFFASATITARIEGTSAPEAKVDLPLLDDAPRYGIRFHFAGPAGSTLAITYTETGAKPIPDDTANIAVSAITLAPDP